jgi:ABC-type bacteriocin/lantibiotic exporters, contain an N-terminal double-glycine peptidase domain
MLANIKNNLSFHRMEVGMLELMRKYFRKCTVIIVSHRLRSIMKTDRVIVLEAGKMAVSILTKNKNNVTKDSSFSMVTL